MPALASRPRHPRPAVAGGVVPADPAPSHPRQSRATAAAHASPDLAPMASAPGCCGRCRPRRPLRYKGSTRCSAWDSSSPPRVLQRAHRRTSPTTSRGALPCPSRPTSPATTAQPRRDCYRRPPLVLAGSHPAASRTVCFLGLLLIDFIIQGQKICYHAIGRFILLIWFWILDVHRRKPVLWCSSRIGALQFS
jgi:hypothetical protein